MKTLVLGVALSLAAGLASAQDHKVYLGGHLGQAKVDGACDGLSGTGVSCDDQDTSWKILGGYQVNKNFAVELGYIDFGEVRASDLTIGTVSIEASAFDLVGVGILPLADRFSAYGKLGVYHGTTKARARTIFVVDDLEEDSTDLTFGFGAAFDLTRQFTVRAEWQRYSDVGGGDIGKADIDVISVGGLFRF